MSAIFITVLVWICGAAIITLIAATYWIIFREEFTDCDCEGCVRAREKEREWQKR